MIKRVLGSGYWVVGLVMGIGLWVLGNILPYVTHSYAASDIAYVEKLFLEGKYDKAADESGKLIDARSRQRDELYYIKGLSELKLNRFSDARQSFEDIIAKYQRSKRIFDAYLGIGDSYFLEGNTDAASRSYNELLNRFPNDNNIAVVRSRIAESNRKPKSEDRPLNPFSVQVGSFKSKSNAQRLVQKLSRQGYEAYLAFPADAGDRLYRVRVGKLKSKVEASALAAKLKRAGYNIKICTDETCQ